MDSHSNQCHLDAIWTGFHIQMSGGFFLALVPQGGELGEGLGPLVPQGNLHSYDTSLFLMCGGACLFRIPAPAVIRPSSPVSTSLGSDCEQSTLTLSLLSADCSFLTQK